MYANIPCVYEKNIYSAVVEYSVPHMSVRFNLLMLFRCGVSLLIFFLLPFHPLLRKMYENIPVRSCICLSLWFFVAFLHLVSYFISFDVILLHTDLELLYLSGE